MTTQTPRRVPTNKTRPAAPDNQAGLVVKLKATDKKNYDGTDFVQLFSYPMAQRILDIKHPFKGWVLDDEDYKMENGSILPVAKTQAVEKEVQTEVIEEKITE